MKNKFIFIAQNATFSLKSKSNHDTQTTLFSTFLKISVNTINKRTFFGNKFVKCLLNKVTFNTFIALNNRFYDTKIRIAQFNNLC